MRNDLWMLDTNTVSYLMRDNTGEMSKKLGEYDISSICISVVTEAELRYGIEKKPAATQLRQLVDAFLIRVTSLSWTSDVAQSYAQLRSVTESRGLSLGNLDMMIASHALAVNATLVTSDKAFFQLKDLIALDDWRHN